VPIYAISEITRELRQAEIITNISQFSYDATSEEVTLTPRPFAVVLTQDCDLLWDHQAKVDGKPRDLIGVLLYEAEPISQIRARLPGSDILRRIMRHGEERYHRLPLVPPDLDVLGEGLPELIIDFRRYFTLPVDEIYRQCILEGKGEAKRRCRLESPYREHLQLRAGYYFQRVGLPD
jgi:hypothetical protein